MTKNKISVIIPVYNEQKMIGECLAALARQTVSPDEIIVVDNNSTDRTVALVRRYYPKIKIVREPRQGIVYARNRGFNEARGNILARIDADTQVADDWIERLHAVFADLRIAAVGGQVWYYDRPCQRAALWVDKIIRRAFVWSAQHEMLQGCNMALRRMVWRKVQPHTCLRTDVHEDMDLGVHLRDGAFHIMYDPGLWAGISARRLDTPLGRFCKYIAAHVRTYRLHHWQGVGGALCLCGVILVVYAINAGYQVGARWREMMLQRALK